MYTFVFSTVSLVKIWCRTVLFEFLSCWDMRPVPGVALRQASKPSAARQLRNPPRKSAECASLYILPRHYHRVILDGHFLSSFHHCLAWLTKSQHVLLFF